MTPSSSCNRRQFLGAAVGGLGAGLSLRPQLSLAATLQNGHPLAPRPGHAPARARHLIFVFLTGGVSHVDTFDFKPKLKQDAGKTVPGPTLRETSSKPLLPSPFRFRQHGAGGLWISELFPQLGQLADELCVIRTLHTDIVEHFQATLAMHTGSATVPLPSIGAWLSYGLGTYNPNLPSYIALCENLPYAGAQVWDNGFLPPYHQGVRIRPGAEPIPDLLPPAQAVSLRELEQHMLQGLNEEHARLRPEDLNLPARIASFDTARGMMRVAPQVFGLGLESPSTLQHYGLERGDQTSFAAQCLTARRLIEAGVRVVELIDTGSNNNWDAHSNMEDHRPKARRVDQALAGLIQDLKQRGLLDDTLLAICTEFGRTPYTDGPANKGRNHYAQAFSSLLVGGGVKGGHAYGETNEYGTEIVKDPCHVHDYHATILHLMGMDHKRLTYRYAGRDFRLTDVHGRVLHDVIA